MNTSRLSLLLGAAGLAVLGFAGCSSPAEDDGNDPTGLPPNPFGTPQGGAGGAPVTGLGGSPAGVVGGSTGAAPVGQGGGAPVTAMGGTGGAPAAGMGGGSGTIPIGVGTVITPDAMGWVAGAMNQFGIQGSFYTFNDNMDGGTSTISATPDFTGGRVCVTGSGAAVPVDPVTMMGSYGTHWGAGVGFNLADPGNMTGPGDWNRGTVIGFTFNITGTQIPPGTQFRFGAAPVVGGQAVPNYCTPGIVMGANRIEFNNIFLECYNTPPGAPIPATAPLESIQWQVSTVTVTPTPFNFCIENLTPITM